MSKLKIHGPNQSRALRTVWMANELGLDYEQDTMDFRSGVTRKPEYLSINRAGHVPAIEDGDFALGESCAINIYLAKKHGKLMPKDLQGEARVLEWSFWVMTDVEKPILNYLFHAAMLPEDQRDPKVVEQSKKDLEWPLTVLNNHLADHDYLVGNEFTVADLNVAGVLLWAKLSKFDMSAYPNIPDWLNRCTKRPAMPGR